MTDVITRLIRDSELPDTVYMIAGYAVMDYFSTEQKYLALPLQYNVAQRKKFCEELVNVDASVVASTLWLTDGGILEYSGEHDDWMYYPPIPAIPNFPNSLELSDVVNHPKVVEFLQHEVTGIPKDVGSMIDLIETGNF